MFDSVDMVIIIITIPDSPWRDDSHLTEIHFAILSFRLSPQILTDVHILRREELPRVSSAGWLMHRRVITFTEKHRSGALWMRGKLIGRASFPREIFPWRECFTARICERKAD